MALPAVVVLVVLVKTALLPLVVTADLVLPLLSQDLL
jgi:hypothetical protein